MSQVLVRHGEVDDHEAAIAVWADSDAARTGRPVLDVTTDLLRARLLMPDVWLLVADDAGALVGVTSGMPARADDGAGDVLPGLCHLSLVFVAPSHWRQGIGRRLVTTALEVARAHGYVRIQLWTHEDNTRAHGLYSATGFVRTGRTKDDDAGEHIGNWARDL